MDNDEQQPPSRELLIDKAVKFLDNPRVASSPLEQKRTFLRRKGLSDDEIDVAFQRSSQQHDDSSPAILTSYDMRSPAVPRAPPCEIVRYYPLPLSPMQRFRDTIQTLFVFCSLAYGSYRVVVQYVIPYLQQRSARLKGQVLPPQLTAEQRTIEFQRTLTDQIVELQLRVRDLQTSLSDHHQKLTSLCSTGDFPSLLPLRGGVSVSRNEPVTQQQFLELKQELSSVKGLLLGRNQFPSIPTLQPIVPKWQLQQSPPKQTATVIVHSDINGRTTKSDLNSQEKPNHTGEKPPLLNGHVQLNGANGSESVHVEKGIKSLEAGDAQTPNHDVAAFASCTSSDDDTHTGEKLENGENSPLTAENVASEANNNDFLDCDSKTNADQNASDTVAVT